ncbi:MAG: hypothetical protein GJU76_08105 [Gallionella sp.]|jgi:uncharacterized protein YaeQ|nr:hypothetical protein [Gallionella sp.]
MAIKATVHKANLQIADMDRNYYADHALTLARHPSETDERMMVRLLAFALYAEEYLTFAQAMSNDDEPDLWCKDLTGAIQNWIVVGLPDERLIRKACGRSRQVVLITYGRSADIWWNENRDKMLRQSNLTVLKLATETTQAFAAWAQRNMALQCAIQENHIMLTSDAGMLEIAPVVLHGKFREVE